MPRKKVFVDKNQTLSAYTVYTAKDEIDRDFGQVTLYTARYDEEGKKLSRYFDNHHVFYKLRYLEDDNMISEINSLFENAKVETKEIPTVVIGGKMLVRPSVTEIEKLLMIEDTQARELYDVVIVGAGVTGVSAALTAHMRGLRTLVIERTRILSSLESKPMVQTEIDHPQGIEGQDLAFRLRDAMEDRQEVVLVEGVFAKRLKALGNLYEISTDGAIYRTKSVILSLGAGLLPLGIMGENEFLGRGVYNDPMSDAKYSKGKSAIVLGFDDYSYKMALEIAKYALHVTVLRANKMDMPDKFMEKKLHEKNITLVGPAKVLEMRGNFQLESIKYVNTETGKTYLIDVSVAYVIGKNLHDTKWLAPVLDLDKNGKILVKNQYETNMKGVFAGGDCTRDYPSSMRLSQLDGAALVDRARSYVENWHLNQGIRDSE